MNQMLSHHPRYVIELPQKRITEGLRQTKHLPERAARQFLAINLLKFYSAKLPEPPGSRQGQRKYMQSSFKIPPR